MTSATRTRAARPARVEQPPRSARARRRRERLAPYLFVAPLIVVFCGFYLWPAVSTVASSAFRWGLLNPWSVTAPEEWRFVGAGNYTSTLTDADFWNAALNTALWLVFFPLLVVVLSLLIAILAWYAGRAGAFFRVVFVLPMTISLAAAGVIWSFVYNSDPDIGVLNAMLRAIGIYDASVHVGPFSLHLGPWLGNPGALHLGAVDIRFSNLALIVAGAWAFTGFGVITLTAGLTGISEELVEAARVDGARASQVVRYVLVPSLRGPIIVVAVVSVIFALRTFDIVYVMTGGGPAQDTEVLALLLWQQAFAFLDQPEAGAAAAIAVIMSAVLVVASYPYLRKLGVRGRR